MSRRILLAVFVAVAGLGLTSGWTAPGPMELKLPIPEIEELPNGLKLVWFLSDHLPVVDLTLLVRSGYQEDPEGKSGTAELVSASLDRGNAGLTAQQFARQVEELGASRYVSSDEDTFITGVHGLAPDANTLLEILGKLALQPDFPEPEVKREHARMLDRWNHLGDFTESLVSIVYQRLLTANTIYGRGSFFSAKEFSKVGREDVVAYHRKHFTPKNSILMVVGRVGKAEFRQKILAGFGSPEKWRGEAPARLRVPFADKRVQAISSGSRRGPTPEVVVIERPGATQAQVRLGFHAPLFRHPDHYALVVANALLGEYFNSRLNSEIRDKQGLTYGIGSSFSYSRELATWSIGSATRSETTGKLLEGTLKILKEMKGAGVSEDEVRMAKEYLIGGYPLGVSTLGAVASRWLAGYIFDLGPSYLNEFVPRVGQIVKADVSSAASRHLDLGRLVIVAAGDAKTIEKSLKASGFSFRRVSVGDLK